MAEQQGGGGEADATEHQAEDNAHPRLATLLAAGAKGLLVVLSQRPVTAPTAPSWHRMPFSPLPTV